MFRTRSPVSTDSLRRALAAVSSRVEDAFRSAGHRLIARYPSLEPPMVKLWYEYIYLYVRGVGLWNSVRHDAPIDPFRVYRVDPELIERRQHPHPKEKYKYFGRIQGGDWDRNLDRFEETDLYRSFEAHFERGVDWEETPFFQRVVGEIDEGRSRWDCESKAEFRQRCEGLDDLYRQIATNGYRTQRELATTGGEPIGKGRHSIVHRLLYDEITVSIGRDGDIIFNDGRHRLAIAKLLDLEEIPVRIMVRHSHWQRIRDAVASAEVDWQQLPDHLQTNPDLRALKDGRGPNRGRRGNHSGGRDQKQ